MADRPTCDEALALARAALEDDKRMTPGPWHVGGYHDASENGDSHDGDIITYAGMPAPLDAPCPSVSVVRTRENMRCEDAEGIAAARTREPQLAAFVEAVLTTMARAARDGWDSEAGRELDGMMFDAMRLIPADAAERSGG